MKRSLATFFSGVLCGGAVVAIVAHLFSMSPENDRSEAASAGPSPNIRNTENTASIAPDDLENARPLPNLKRLSANQEPVTMRIGSVAVPIPPRLNAQQIYDAAKELPFDDFERFVAEVHDDPIISPYGKVEIVSPYEKAEVLWHCATTWRDWVDERGEGFARARRADYLERATERIELAMLKTQALRMRIYQEREDLYGPPGEYKSRLKWLEHLMRLYEEVEQYSIFVTRDEFIGHLRTCQAIYKSAVADYVRLPMIYSSEDHAELRGKAFYSIGFWHACEMSPLDMDIFYCMSSFDHAELTTLNWLQGLLQGKKTFQSGPPEDFDDSGRNHIEAVITMLENDFQRRADSIRNAIPSEEVERARKQREELRRLFGL